MVQTWEVITATTTGRDYSPYLKPMLLLWTGEGATSFGFGCWWLSAVMGLLSLVSACRPQFQPVRIISSPLLSARQG